MLASGTFAATPFADNPGATTEVEVFLVEEIASASDEVYASVTTWNFVEEVGAGDDNFGGAEESVEEIASASDEVTTAGYPLIDDDAAGSDSHAIGLVFSLLESAAGADSALVTAHEELTEVAEATDAASFNANALSISDAAYCSDELTAGATGYVELAEAGAGTDALVTGGVATIDDVAVADDAAVLTHAVTIEELAAGSDETLTSTTQRADLVIEVGAGAEEVTSRVTAQQLVSEVATSRDEMFYADPARVAWVMNTDSTAVSWYTNYGFNAIAQAADGTVYAVGPAGLYVLSGDSDSGAEIEASVVWGKLEFGGYDDTGNPKENPQIKRLEALYVGYTSSTSLSVRIGADTQADELGTYTYEMPEVPTGTPANGRIVPGKGVRGRYWYVELCNTDGGSFKVTHFAALPTNTARRI